MRNVITLVHGTGAPYAAWTEERSSICTRLSSALGHDVAFRVFNWSGANSARARRAAAAELTADLIRLVEREPDARHFLIGHSHGGNVALQSLSDPRVRSKMAGVACLSTPFLQVRQRDLGPVGLSQLAITLWVVVGLLMASLNAHLSPSLRMSSGSPLQHPENMWLFLLGCVAGSPLMLLSYLLWKRAVSRSTELREIIQLPDLTGIPVLIIRSSGDEASGALTTASFLSWCTSRTWEWITRFSDKQGRGGIGEMWRRGFLRRWLVFTAIFFPFVVLFLQMTPLQVDNSFARTLEFALFLALMIGAMNAMTWPYYVGGVVLFALIAFFPLAALTMSAWLWLAFGREFWLCALLVEISAEPTPSGKWTLHELPAQDRKYANDGTAAGPAMLHSTYDDSRALDILSSWLNEATIAA
jgi:pimeloyl-ACP methyl ester carboxylesterase